jgi:photosystem II PsbY protein
MDIDWRILIVLSPVLLAAGWALFNVGAIALRQAQAFLNRS